jgi:phosphoribosylamine--glycine ligase/phosphoribosylformylglycinamidine cyclo-ligase
MLPRPTIQPGDVLLGLSSSGVHSNGFSLIRKIVALSGLTYASPCPWESEHARTLGRALLEPTRIYVKQVLPAARAGLIKGMAHVTGGGFLENVPRVLPDGMGCVIDASAWRLPPVFRYMMQAGGVAPLEMARTFNNGIGMVLVVGRDKVDAVKQSLQNAGGDADVYEIGEVVPGNGVDVRHLEAWNA